jgi:hypothetical protein
MFELAKIKAASKKNNDDNGSKNQAREVAYELLIQLV